MPTLRLQCLPQSGDQKNQRWLAPELGFVPARIHMQEAHGDALALVLTRVASHN